MKTRVGVLLIFTLTLLLSSIAAAPSTHALSVDEINTLKATDTILTAIPEENSSVFLAQIAKYNATTTPHSLTYPLGLQPPEQAIGKYINITLGNSSQGTPLNLTETAKVQIYYRETELDKTANGLSGDLGDIDENTLTLYLFDETSNSTNSWKKLGKFHGVTDFGINTTNVELYGEKYAGNVWFQLSLANVSFFALAGIQTNLSYQPPTTNPVTVTNVNAITPTISWTYTVQSNAPQVMYEVEVWTSPGGSGTEMWNPAAAQGTSTSIVYAGAPLNPGQTFYARVRAASGDGWGPWSETAFMIITETFTQYSDPPTAAFTESAHVAPVGTPISFDPSGSHAVDGKIILYEWDWESDGIYDESHENLMVVVHTFMIPGQYTVTLRVTDDKGFTNECSETKTITPNLQVVPEVPMGTITATIALFGALFTAIKWSGRRKTKI